MSQFDKNKLQYDNGFLDKIIISALMDQRFLIKCIDLDVAQYIDSQPHKWLLKFIVEFYIQYKVSPTMQSIKIKIESLKQPLFKQTVSTTYISIINKFDENNLEFIKDTVVNFCRFQQLKNAIMKSIDLLKEENFEQIYDLINQTRFKGIDNGMGIEYVSSFLQRHNYNMQTYKVVETPWTVLNNVMDGGAKSGRLNLIVSPPGTGKSWFLCNIAAHALKLGKKVVYYTLEMEQWQIAQRIDIKLLNKPKQYIRTNAEKLAPQLQHYRDNLRVKQFLPGHTKLIEIENHVTQLVLFENFDPDVIIIDHGDNLKLQGNVNNLYGAYGTNFVGMKKLAKRTKKIVWSASQGNRCLSKNSKVNVEGKNEITIDKVQINDKIETPNGYKIVSKVYKEKQSVYKIKLKNGKQIVCSANHQFPVEHGLLKSLQTGLKVGDKLYVKKEEIQ